MRGDQPRGPRRGDRADLQNTNRTVIITVGRGRVIIRASCIWARAGSNGRGCMTYKSRLAGVDEWFGGEPFPHESARGPVVDRVDQPANVVVN